MSADLSPETTRLVADALAEDIGSGDRTTLWTVPESTAVTARIVAKASGVIAGLEIAREAFRQVDHDVRFESQVADGDAIEPGAVLISLDGPARGILTAERVALNFLQQLSGVASVTREYVRKVEGTGARILDTRKTTPLLRALEREAVRAGGGTNHRFGLFDMVLIKENHIRSAGGITEAVAAVRRRNDAGLRVEIETTSLEEVREALPAGVDRIMLDNMSVETMREALEIIQGADRSIETEASGGVNLETVRAIAETGVDFISVGALTHSAPALDLSLLVDLESTAK